MSGPVPKRSSQRRRQNKPDVPVEHAEGAPVSDPPESDESWHPVALAWFTALGKSGQSQFYEPSDWQVAVLIAESISRDLKPQFVGFEEGVDDDGHDFKKVALQALPLKGSALTAYLRGMSSLLVTEGDRRRLRLELEKPPEPGSERDAAISDLASYRSGNQPA